MQVRMQRVNDYSICLLFHLNLNGIALLANKWICNVKMYLLLPCGAFLQKVLEVKMKLQINQALNSDEIYVHWEWAFVFGLASSSPGAIADDWAHWSFGCVCQCKICPDTSTFFGFLCIFGCMHKLLWHSHI